MDMPENFIHRSYPLSPEQLAAEEAMIRGAAASKVCKLVTTLSNDDRAMLQRIETKLNTLLNEIRQKA
jgi:hypothetical protein